jgi:hypothetical protein
VARIASARPAALSQQIPHSCTLAADQLMLIKTVICYRELHRARVAAAAAGWDGAAPSRGAGEAARSQHPSNCRKQEAENDL